MRAFIDQENGACLTSCAGIMCHARREYLAQNCNSFSVLSILKYNPGKTNNKFIAS